MIKKNVMPKNYEHVKCPYCKSGNTTWKAKESTPYNQKWQCDMCLRTFNYKVPHKGKSMIQVFRDKIMPKKHYIKLIGASAVFANPTTIKLKNPHSDLYESFHGSKPARKRMVSYENPTGPLIKIGRIRRIDYEPEFPSKHRGTQFYHMSGDTGSRKLPSNLILATDEKGENFYLIKDKPGKYPLFSERGILG